MAEMENRRRLNIYGRAAIAVLLAGIICFAYIMSPLPMFWEHEDQPMVYSITWHSGLVFLTLLAFSYALTWPFSRKK
jgi:hypothetical protein